MHLLVSIDIPAQGLDAFNAYEDRVLSRLEAHGGQLGMRMRSPDGRREVHLLTFPDAVAREAFLADPERESHRHLWTESGARADTLELERLDA
ncbi:MAG: hypothetical protein R3C13_02940 [Hyphomonas sp.]|uniref:hypothetical protein n=1 Tax=Hyphomonas sp. TaxID=87 RepID=UPI003527382F